MFIWSKIVDRVREREDGSYSEEIIRPEKIVPCKCCLPRSNISVKQDFDADVLLSNVVTHCQSLTVPWTKYKQIQYLIDKDIWGKM